MLLWRVSHLLGCWGEEEHLICLCCPAGDGCGPSLLGPVSGTLSSLGYPGTYPNGTVCEWEISVPPGSRIHFRFAELDIENPNCQVSYLGLYDGIGPKRSVIGECSLPAALGEKKKTKPGIEYSVFFCEFNIGLN